MFNEACQLKEMGDELSANFRLQMYVACYRYCSSQIITYVSNF